MDIKNEDMMPWERDRSGLQRGNDCYGPVENKIDEECAGPDCDISGPREKMHEKDGKYYCNKCAEKNADYSEKENDTRWEGREDPNNPGYFSPVHVHAGKAHATGMASVCPKCGAMAPRKFLRDLAKKQRGQFR